MAVYSIICEYNPFHNGHKYQIDSLKPNTVVCLMSSNAVQRGTFAVCDKYSRAKAALNCGADLVLELPYPFSMLSAEYFASAGIKILDSLGFVDALSFGCECADYDILRRISAYLMDETYKLDVAEIISAQPSIPYAAAREQAVRRSLGDEFGDVLKYPNNILAVEYIKAIIKNRSSIIPHPLQRRFAQHHSELPTGNFASAGTLRDMIAKGESIEAFVPAEAYNVYKELSSGQKMPSDMKKLENAILAFLRMTPAQELKKYYDCEAVAPIIKKAAQISVSLEELYENCATASFTRARMRRCITAAYLGIDIEFAHSSPLYTSVLALNDKGAELLSKTRKNCDIAVITKPAHIKKYEGTEVYRQYMAGVTADDIFALSLPQAQKAGENLKKTPTVLKK